MKKLFWRFLLVVCFFILLFTGLIFFYPEPNNFQIRQESSKIYDRNGELLYEILIPETGKQDFVSLEKISLYLKDSILAIEDQDFYQHFGIDFSALSRAFWQNLYYGEIISGASTIEQQLARNLLKNDDRTYFNKFREIALALKFNFKYEKKEILEKYLNTVYFGNLAYGIETASQTYFGKTSAKLDLAESAFLAGLPQSPGRFSPYINLTAGLNRQKQVLQALLKQNKISQEDYDLAFTEDLNFQKQKLVKIKAPHFVMWILDQLEKEKLLREISKGGYEITTTLDLGLQEEIQNLVDLHLDKLVSQNISNASVVVLNQWNGEILTMLGSRDYFDESIDGKVNVTLSLRQPGSTLKPFLYALAFENGLMPNTTILDEAVSFDSVDGRPYEPKNYDLQYHGEVTLREALAQSLNIPAVKILDFVGINTFLNKLRDLGMTTLNQSAEHYGLALALGSGEVKFLDLTQAYGILGNGGIGIELTGILQMKFRQLKQSVQNISEQHVLACCNEQLFSNQVVAQITSILTDNFSRIPAFGEENPLKFNYPVAAKTGTSRNFRDNWTLGYTSQLTVGVWVGNSDGSAMINSSGITGSAPLFHTVMDLVMQNLPKKFFAEVEMQNKPTNFEEFVNSKNPKENQREQKQSLISYPYDGDIFQLSLNIPLERQVLTFKASEEGEWFLNNEFLRKSRVYAWQMEKGEYQLKFINEKSEEKISFSVR